MAIDPAATSLAQLQLILHALAGRGRGATQVRKSSYRWYL